MLTKLSYIVAMKKKIARKTCHARSKTVWAVKKTIYTAHTSMYGYIQGIEKGA